MADLAKCFAWLDDLRNEGTVNMFGARPYLADEFDLDRKESADILAKWQTSFDGKSSPEDRAAKFG